MSRREQQDARFALQAERGHLIHSSDARVPAVSHIARRVPMRVCRAPPPCRPIVVDFGAAKGMCGTKPISTWSSRALVACFGTPCRSKRMGLIWEVYAMQVDIRTRLIEVDEVLRAHVDRRLRFGVDKQCQSARYGAR